MRKTAFLLFLVYTTGVYARVDTVSLSELDVRGKVAKLTEFTYKAVDHVGTLKKGAMVENGTFSIDHWSRPTNFTYSYNASGQQTSGVQHGEYKTSKIYVYQHGKVTEVNEKTVYVPTSKVVITGKELIQYNAAGLVESSTLYLNGNLSLKYLYTYDDNKHRTRYVLLGKNGDIEYECSYERKYEGDKLVYFRTKDPEEGNSVERTVYDSLGRISGRILDEDSFSLADRYFYNPSFNVLDSMIRRDGSGAVTMKHLYSYDAQGRQVGIKHVYDTGDSSETLITYDGPVKRETTVSYQGSDVERTETENGHVVAYRKNDDQYRYQYSFDTRGNWIRIVEYKNTIPTLIRERTIVYHP